MPENYANKYQTALSAGITAGALTGTVTSVTGVPTVPFRAIISAEGANTEEIVLVTVQAGTTLTWTRAAEAIAGVQVASAHSSGATLTAIVTATAIGNLETAVAAIGVAPLDLWIGPPNFLMANTLLSIGSANWGMVYMFQVFRAVTVTKVCYALGVSSGNASFGIYRYDSATVATRIATTGAFALPVAAIPLTRALLASCDLTPGVRYYAAITCDNNTATFTGALMDNFPFDGTTVPDLLGVIGAFHPCPTSFNPSTDPGQVAKLLQFRFV